MISFWRQMGLAYNIHEKGYLVGCHLFFELHQNTLKIWHCKGKDFVLNCQLKSSLFTFFLCAVVVWGLAWSNIWYFLIPISAVAPPPPPPPAKKLSLSHTLSHAFCPLYYQFSPAKNIFGLFLSDQRKNIFILTLSD